MIKIQTLVALITGASSGIGAALARGYAAKGHSLVLIARRKEKLEGVKTDCMRINRDIKVMAAPCDATDFEGLKKTVESAKDYFGRLDVVVANAGFALSGALSQLTLEDYRRQFEINIFGVLNTAYTTLDELKKTEGRLAIMGSVSSYLSGKNQSPYSMSKYAVRALAEALYGELKPEGVSVTLICPGFVASEIRRLDKMGQFHEERDDPVPQWLVMDVDKAARQMIRAIQGRTRERIITGHGQIAVFIKRHFPFLVSWFY